MSQDTPDATQRPPEEPRVARRELFGAAVSGLAGLAAACSGAGGRTEAVDTPEGKVYQWERDDLLVLVSGLRDSYQAGEELRFKVLLNNQTNRFGLFRVRTKLAGRGQQVVAEAPVASVQVKPFDATEVERTLGPTSALTPGDYSLVVELPPWSLEGRTLGGGALSAPVTLR